MTKIYTTELTEDELQTDRDLHSLTKSTMARLQSETDHVLKWIESSFHKCNSLAETPVMLKIVYIEKH